MASIMDFNSKRFVNNDSYFNKIGGFKKNIYRSAKFDASLKLSFFKDDVDKTFLTKINVSYRNGRWLLRSSSDRSYKNNDEKKSRYTQYIQWRDEDILDEELTINGIYDVSDKSQKKEINLRLSGKYGTVRTEVENNGNYTSYNSSLNFNILTNNKDFALAGKRSAQSGVIVNIEDSSNDDSYNFEVFNERRSIGLASANKKSPIMLEPFKDYYISVNAKKGTLANVVDGDYKKITLMPGNVLSLNWESRRSFILIAKLIDSNNKPLANKAVNSSLENGMTDSDGYFQIYSNMGDEIIANMDNQKQCKYEIPDNLEIEDNGVAFLEDVECKEIASKSHSNLK